MKRKVIVALNPEWFAWALRLPSGIAVTGEFHIDFNRNSVLVKLSSDIFEEVGEAQPIPHAELVMRADGKLSLVLPDGRAFTLDGGG